jgi:threonine dehydrogenase-like Zn-dependent dehydrogenase
MALVVGGGYAQYCPAHESHALPVPAGVTLTEAAAIPETFFTVWHNAFERGRLRAGEALLVHGGSSGIGTAAIQLAKAFAARVVATAGSDEKCQAADVSGQTQPLTIRPKTSSPRPRPDRRQRGGRDFGHGRGQLHRAKLRGSGNSCKRLAGRIGHEMAPSCGGGRPRGADRGAGRCKSND